MRRDKKLTGSAEHSNKIAWILLAITAFTLALIFWPPFYNVLHSYDIQALRAINSNRLTILDPFFIFITNTSSIVCLIIISITLLTGVVNKNKHLITNGLQLSITFLSAFILIKSLKYLVDRERPYITYNFLDKLAHAESLSFPSGHTFEAFAFATAIALLFKYFWLRLTIFLWAGLVGLSRLVLGMHYLSDVIGGLILGILTAYAVHELYKKNIMARDNVTVTQ